MIVSNERENALRTEKVLRRIAEGDAIVEEQVMKRGEIYHADLNPVFGSEQGGYRPVLIIQNNRGNQHSQRRPARLLLHDKRGVRPRPKSL